MYVSRQMALEILGLNEDFTKEEFNENFRRLSKIVHPDAGGDESLFKFIMCCKETLLNESKTNDMKKTHKESKVNDMEKTHKESEKDFKKKVGNINLSTLYWIYFELNCITSEYDIDAIKCKAQIFITPCGFKKYCESTTINLSESFIEFRQLGFANFSTTVKLPERFKKFNKFNVRMEFMGETFEFKLAKNSPFHIIKYEETAFNSIVELTFE